MLRQVSTLNLCFPLQICHKMQQLLSLKLIFLRNRFVFFLVLIRDELRRLARSLPFKFTCLLHGYIEPRIVVVHSSVMIN